MWKEAPNGEGSYWDEKAGQRELQDIQKRARVVDKENWLRMGFPGDFLDRDEPGFWLHHEDD
jgi:hypothetical protein